MLHGKKIPVYLLIVLLILSSNSWDTSYRSNLYNPAGITSIQQKTGKGSVLSISEQIVTKFKIRVRIKAGESPDFNCTSYTQGISFEYYDHHNGIIYSDFVSTAHFRLYKLRGPPQLTV